MTDSRTTKWNIKILASPKIFYFMLFYLVFILFVGTITQVELGIYGALERYFAAWITWCFANNIPGESGFSIPVPGGRLVLLLMSVNLTCKLVFASRWHLKGLGVHIAHLGTLLLMIGALLTAYFSVEGSLYIPEGGSSAFYVDNEQAALRVIDTSDNESDFDQVTAFSGHYLDKGAEITHAAFAGRIRILEYFRNASLEEVPEKQGTDWRGLGRNHVVIIKRGEKEQTKNKPVAIVELKGFDESSNGRYIVSSEREASDVIRSGIKTFRLGLGSRVYKLPNDMRFELVDFVAEYHAGTRKPKHFASHLRIHENGTVRQALIQMNEPLRTHGHTFFQSSFDQMNGMEATILTVVKNYGRMFPYISSIVICIGIGLHLILHYPAFLARLKARRSDEEDA